MFVQGMRYYPTRVLWDREREWGMIIEIMWDSIFLLQYESLPHNSAHRDFHTVNQYQAFRLPILGRILQRWVRHVENISTIITDIRKSISEEVVFKINCREVSPQMPSYPILTVHHISPNPSLLRNTQKFYCLNVDAEHHLTECLHFHT